jgi:thioredoxin reductase
MKKVHETIIIGAGISGLACARKLHENNKEFLVISEDIGGKILTSDDGKVNYGACLMFGNYHHIKKLVKINTRIKIKKILFHKRGEKYKAFPRMILLYPLGFINGIILSIRFIKHYEAFKKKCETVSQVQALKEDPFLFKLYTQNTLEFLHKHKLKKMFEDYSGWARITNFVPFLKIRPLSILFYFSAIFLQVYHVTFLLEKMFKGFKNKIIFDTVNQIKKDRDKYIIKTPKRNYYANNVVVATSPPVSKKLLNLKKIKKPVIAHVFHLHGKIRKPWDCHPYNLFSDDNSIFGITKYSKDYIIYAKTDKLDLKKYFHEYKIIKHTFWNPAHNLIGDTLWECEQDKNLYLIGDHNIPFLEEAYITGLYAANQIINSK